MDSRKKVLGNLYITKDCVDREIRDANAYYKLLFKWVNGILKNKMFYRNFNIIFHYIKDALETKYILSLTKIFAVRQEESLLKLIRQAKNISNKDFELKLEREPDFIHDQMREERKEFFKKFDIYVTEIAKIEKRVNPLRNIQKAHNFPLRPQGKKVSYQDTQVWLDFAEKVFVNAMDAICETSPRIGEFFPDNEFDTRISHFVSIIEDVERNMGQKE